MVLELADLRILSGRAAGLVTTVRRGAEGPISHAKGFLEGWIGHGPHSPEDGLLPLVRRPAAGACA